MSHPKRQHYVPRFLLEKFARVASEQIFVFDKLTGKQFSANIKNAAAENGFYDVTFADGILTIEPALAKVEEEAARIVRQLTDCPNLFLLKDDDKTKLAGFISLQMVRGPNYRAFMKQAAEGMLKAAKRFYPDAPIDEKEYLPDDKALRLMALRAIEESPKNIPPLLDKTWLLFSVKDDRAFYSSDNPVVLGNSQAKRENWGISGLGLFSRGVEIYVPLAHNLILALFCRSYEEGWAISEAKAQILRKYGAYEMPPHLREVEQKFEAVMQGVRRRRPVEIDADLLAHQNSMQVVFAERFLFSPSNDFSLAQERIGKFPELKEGRKLEFR